MSTKCYLCQQNVCLSLCVTRRRHIGLQTTVNLMSPADTTQTEQITNKTYITPHKYYPTDTVRPYTGLKVRPHQTPRRAGFKKKDKLYFLSLQGLLCKRFSALLFFRRPTIATPLGQLQRFVCAGTLTTLNYFCINHGD